jgi:tetratricopeptide (TPR) repeat protein
MKRNKKHFYKTIVLCLFCLIISKSYSQNNNTTIVFDSANYQYSKGNYEKAIQFYESILAANIEAPELYYNLGNGYYKINQIGLAILNYEKAKKMTPKDEDIENNLMLANLKTEDKINPLPELFIDDWINGISNLMSEKNWSIACIIIMCISLTLFAFYFLSTVVMLKKMFFYSAFLSLTIVIFTFFMARHKYTQMKNDNYAVIISPSSIINSSPSEKSTKLFILHEGTKVNIINEDSDWVEIKLANSKVGWIPKKELERI